ncbi:MAG: 2-C-methyl-D-erythritol 4-phosphate cytidylyltransferase [Defluviitaleaceae bacterium]|nr:2-C-methyl-D-erythritol 4-phosphate cytidylyltransferase [Defluviitaleaceae bacterium]MCL2274009.1 2-C-methyl-D-erythritol 4-phosphate cytidylyltransferase [Defluviitaleaceae bacterium]MCL2274090.1 2-C-methyl-D-erythritol 4-phosphate cytidylyltransferase [Defluviitaleaceae bacterium]
MVSVIIAAAGSGTRFGGETPKQFLQLGEKPVLAHSIQVFQRISYVNEIAVAVPQGHACDVLKMVHDHGLCKVKHVIDGCESRSESICNALQHLNPKTEIVLIHDGVRPLVSAEIIHAVTSAARKHGAAITGLPFTDTVKEVDESGRIVATPMRARFRQVQTPQGFLFPLILDAYKNTPSLAGFTDDSAIFEANGGAVYVVEGDPHNIKITTREDLLLAHFLLEAHV